MFGKCEVCGIHDYGCKCDPPEVRAEVTRVAKVLHETMDLMHHWGGEEWDELDNLDQNHYREYVRIVLWASKDKSLKAGDSDD